MMIEGTQGRELRILHICKSTEGKAVAQFKLRRVDLHHRASSRAKHLARAHVL